MSPRTRQPIPCIRSVGAPTTQPDVIKIEWPLPQPNHNFAGLQGSAGLVCRVGELQRLLIPASVAAN